MIYRPTPSGPPTLKITISNWLLDQPAGAQPPVAGIYNTGTPEFRYWTAVEALTRGAIFWNTQLPDLQWQTGNTLPIILDAGTAFNASYSRENLQFFMNTVDGRDIHTGESPDILCHEQGHAILDAIKPELFDVFDFEVSAFHEAFADCSSILCALQLPSVRTEILKDTGNQLNQDSSLSRLAEQLGWAIRQHDPQDTEADCFRNAFNPFVYNTPHNLPKTGPSTVLTAGAHSLCRVFTGAFFEGLAGLFSVQPTQDEQSLLQTSADIAQLLIAAVKKAPVTQSFFGQVAGSMVSEANSKFSASSYSAVLQKAFTARGIVPPGTNAGPAQPLAPGDTIEISLGENDLNLAAVPTVRLRTSKYGFEKKTVLVKTPHHKVAKLFLDDLLRTNCLKTEIAPLHEKSMKQAPQRRIIYEPYTHELRREGNHIVLRRIRFNCGHIPKSI
jgi:hypothetical protein